MGSREQAALMEACLSAGYKQRVGGKPLLQCCCGVYAMRDLDGDVIYVGQTRERIATRTRRHLSGQRTDAVISGALDPWEVASMLVYPFPELEPKGELSGEILNAAERQVMERARADNRYRSVQNEKALPAGTMRVELPEPVLIQVLPPEVVRLRQEDYLPRRTMKLAAIAQRLSEKPRVSLEAELSFRRQLHDLAAKYPLPQ